MSLALTILPSHLEGGLAFEAPAFHFPGFFFCCCSVLFLGRRLKLITMHVSVKMGTLRLFWNNFFLLCEHHQPDPLALWQERDSLYPAVAKP